MTSTQTSPPSPPAHVSADALTLGYGRAPVIAGLDLQIPPGAVTGIVGANGCGKSTLLKGLGRLLAPAGGAVLLDGRDISTLPTRALARRLGLLPQAPATPEGMTVAELVALGRHPHRGPLGGLTRADHAAIDDALAATDTRHLASRRADELSGGQRQRVWIATVLAQRTDVLLLDEPTSFLDLAHAVDILDLIGDLNRRAATTIVMVLHDLSLAARYCDHLVAMRQGRVAAHGAPERVVTAEVIDEVFGLTATVIPDPVSGAPLVIPHSRRRDRADARRPADPTPVTPRHRAG